MAQKPDVASNEKNEYIPAFITKKPFWVPDDESAPSSDYLEHQRLQKEEEQSRWYDRGKKKGPAATKYRKGACENCGAMTHKTKECLSRPRVKGARWTGKNIQADEVIQDVKLGWDAKRDRWNGYDASEYLNVVKDHEELEKMKKAAREGDAEPAAAPDGAPTDEGARYAEESDMGREQNTATRSLRLREDTAKYLLNLDLDSAKYDPKSRSMVDSGATADEAAALVAEDNFMRASGDAAEFEKAQHFAWESQERGDADKIHLQANPTAGAHLRKKQLEEASAKRESQKKYLMEMYGGGEHQKPDPLKGTAVVESERFVEYDSSGAVKGLQNATGKSKYHEDVLVNNHTSVWGSWWKDFSWGYACCHSTVKNSYCTGETGKEASQKAEQMRLDESGLPSTQEEEPAGSDQRSSAAKKRTAGELKTGLMEEGLEAYKRSRMQTDDPMRNLMGKDELLNE